MNQMRLKIQYINDDYKIEYLNICKCEEKSVELFKTYLYNSNIMLNEIKSICIYFLHHLIIEYIKQQNDANRNIQYKKWKLFDYYITIVNINEHNSLFARIRMLLPIKKSYILMIY